MASLKDLSKIEMGYVIQTVLYNRSRKEIADFFNRSFDTVCCQMKNIYRKLEINSLQELCQKYYSEEFHLTEAIQEKKREIGALSLSFLMLINLAFDHYEFLRIRRYRRRTETEQIILFAPIEGA